MQGLASTCVFVWQIMRLSWGCHRESLAKPQHFCLVCISDIPLPFLFIWLTETYHIPAFCHMYPARRA